MSKSNKPRRRPRPSLAVSDRAANRALRPCCPDCGGDLRWRPAARNDPSAGHLVAQLRAAGGRVAGAEVWQCEECWKFGLLGGAQGW